MDFFHKNITESPLCRCGSIEDTQHYFFHCRFYQGPRNTLLNACTTYQNPSLKSLSRLRLFCDSLRPTSGVGRITVLKQSPVIRNFLACVAKWHKEVAKFLNMFKNFMQQNSSQNSRKVIAGVSKPSQTCCRPWQFSRNHFGTQHICKRNKTASVLNYTQLYRQRFVKCVSFI